jgi:Ni/Co efflux regulator RcnB
MERKRMKILIGIILALLTVAVQPAAAAPWRNFGGGRFDVQAQRQRPGEFQRQPQQDFRRGERPPQQEYRRAPQQDYRRGERPPERDRRGDGRLTDQERRDLRRDIDRANREIYKGRPSR